MNICNRLFKGSSRSGISRTNGGHKLHLDPAGMNCRRKGILEGWLPMVCWYTPSNTCYSCFVSFEHLISRQVPSQGKPGRTQFPWGWKAGCFLSLQKPGNTGRYFSIAELGIWATHTRSGTSLLV